MTYDVAARLDRGRASVSNTQTYVAACHTLGYQQPDLTAHGAQVVQWYGAEDGMDLAVLDADCGRLRAAVGAAEEALQAQRAAAAMLEAGWMGGSGSAATDFVTRHCGSGTAVVTLLRAAADGCAALREALWPLVEDKVHAAVVIDDRRAEVRPAWLAAAQTVMSGAANRAEATDVVTHQITPYVDTEIRTEWLGAMRTATASVAAAYDGAVHRLNAFAPVYFAVPEQLAPPAPDPPRADKPVYSAAVQAPAVVPSTPAASVPAAAPVVSPLPPVTPPPVAADTPVPQPLPQTPPSGIGGAAPPGVPSIPDVGGGLSGLAGQIADALGALSTGQPDLPTEAPAPDPNPTSDDTTSPDEEPKDPEPEGKSPEPPADDTAVTPETDPAPQAQGQPAADDIPSPEPVPADPAPAEPAPPPPEPAEERTPCEIAADELPQVGQ